MVKYHPLAINRQAKFNYEIKQRMLAGVVLLGHEVKSIRAGHVSLKGSFAKFIGNELYVHNMHISPYAPANTADYDPTRSRKLLLKRSELDRLLHETSSGSAIAVTSAGVMGPYIKIELGLGRGKNRGDKRETIKRRQAERDAARVIRGK